MDRAARLLRGTLRVRVESAFPERVLNLCGAHGIAFSDLRWESASALSFTVRAAERKKLERLLAPLDAALTVERAAGAPFSCAASVAATRCSRGWRSCSRCSLPIPSSYGILRSAAARPSRRKRSCACWKSRGCAAAALPTPSARRTSATAPCRSCPSLRGDGQRPRLPRLRQRARPRAQARAGG